MEDMTESGLRRGIGEFDRRVRAVRPEQWADPTPCTEWDVRALVNHLVTEQLWAPLLLDGATIEDIGDRFDGDQLGDDPVAAWASAATATLEAFAAPDVLRRRERAVLRAPPGPGLLPRDDHGPDRARLGPGPGDQG